MSQLPVVSVICIAYNHEKYIFQAIEGILSQKTNFHIEVFIHDDCSTDRTAEIIKVYHKRFPELIKPIYQSENQYSLGRKITPIVYPLCKGRYIAICEGDDYWTDPYKLQKQVDFLDANPDFAICFHSVEINYQSLNKPSCTSNTSQKEVSTIEDLCKGNFLHTPSCVFRNGLIKRFPKWFMECPIGDWPLHMLNALYGKIKYMDEVMAVYRVHNGGVWESKNEIYKHINFLKAYEKIFGHFEKSVDKKLKKQYSIWTKFLAFKFLELDQKDMAFKYFLKHVRYTSLNKDNIYWLIQTGLPPKYLKIISTLKSKIQTKPFLQ